MDNMVISASGIPTDHCVSTETGLSVTTVIESFTFDLVGMDAFDTGCVLKYMCGWKDRNGLDDLKNARYHLNNLIDRIENLEKENM